jgi:hypothetical protein
MHLTPKRRVVLRADNGAQTFATRLPGDKPGQFCCPMPSF